ncbi:hypothetical protein OROGR_027076 [Orobanche gracilis]
MPRRVKEDERIEMIVRGLLKEPENRRCINCNSLGPQYVCTTFWTFVCTICSGVHREFTHRVKSVSMAKFSEEEITALQAGGNERAREIYFKAWDPQRNFYPDGSNLHRLREFVKHVYIDRKYAGENKQLSMIKLDSKINYFERRSNDKNNFFESPLPERRSNNREIDLIGRSSFEQSSPFKRNGGGLTFRDIVEERKSPRNSQELSKSNSQRNRPATATRFEIVDDRFRDDGSVKRYDHRHSSRESRGGSRSPDSQTAGPTNLPSVRPIKEILGEKVPALKFGGPPKFNEQEEDAVSEGSATGQNVNRKQTETVVNPSSLIDFDAQLEPTKNNDIVSGASADTKTAPDGPNTNSLGSLLLDVSDTSQSNGSKAVERAAYVENVPNDRLLEDSSKELTVQVTKQNETSLSPLGNITSSNAQRQSNSSAAWNDLNPVQSVQLEQSKQDLDQEHGSKATTRKEIPQDLFTSNIASFSPPITSWQMHSPYETGYGMQFHPPVMSVAAFPNPSRPKNPFDISDDGFQAPMAMFPSMPSLQGALPNMPASTALVSHASAYARPLPPHMSPYGMNMTQVSGAYMGQLSNNMPLTRPQGNANLAKSEDAFASLNPIQLTSEINSLSDTSSSRTGNPFG